MNENLLFTIAEKIGNLESNYQKLFEVNKGQLEKLDRIEDQTTKTNGRVTKLEDFTKTQLQINSRIEGLYKASQENLKLQINNMEDKTKREIDEFKNRDLEIKKQDVEITKIQLENGWKLKLAIWSTLSVIMIAYFTWLFTAKGNNMIQNTEEIISNQIEK